MFGWGGPPHSFSAVIKTLTPQQANNTSEDSHLGWVNSSSVNAKHRAGPRAPRAGLSEVLLPSQRGRRGTQRLARREQAAPRGCQTRSGARRGASQAARKQLTKPPAGFTALVPLAPISAPATDWFRTAPDRQAEIVTSVTARRGR